MANLHLGLFCKMTKEYTPFSIDNIRMNYKGPWYVRLDVGLIL